MSNTRITLNEAEVCALLHCLDHALATYSQTERHKVHLAAVRFRIEPEAAK